MTAPLLELRGVRAGYGRVPFLDGVDLHVRAGEIVALLGANGAGKTTTIMTIAGHVAPASGELMLAGERLAEAPHRRVRRGLGLVTQERSVFMGLSVQDNLSLGRGAVDEVLDLFPELRPLLAKRAGLLSGGQQQMLSVGRALAAHPTLLLADELSLGLAPLVVDRILGAVRDHCRANGTAVVLVEQHVKKALAVADRAYVLQRGSVVLEGSASAVASDVEALHRAYLPAT